MKIGYVVMFMHMIMYKLGFCLKNIIIISIPI